MKTDMFDTVEEAIAAVLALPEGITRAALQVAMRPGAARNAVDCALWDLELQQGDFSLLAGSEAFADINLFMLEQFDQNTLLAAAQAVTLSEEGLNSDLHGSALYRAALIPVLAARAVAAA